MSKVWVNAKLPDGERARLAAALDGHDVRWAAPTAVLAAGTADAGMAAAEILFGQPDPDALVTATAPRLVQLSSAGYTRYDRDDLRAALAGRGARLCNASSVFAAPVAEHAVAILLALLRRLPEALDEQRGPHGWPYDRLRVHSRRLAGETVLCLGYGAIARELFARLRPFGARLVGHRRRPRGDEGVEIVDDVGLAEALATADHVFDLLPESPSTRGFCDAAFFARCKRGARFYNLGRGATVDQRALVDALRAGHLDAAWLDVITPEPLPPDDPLWREPRLYLSPHTAGGHADEEARLVDLFLHNLAAYTRGGALRDPII